MKTNKLAIMALIVLSAAACKKDDPEPPTDSSPTPTMATIRMGFEFLNGMNDYQLGEQLTDSAGNVMKFDKVRFYASNVELMDMGGNEMAHFHDTYMLAEVGGSNSWTLGDVDPGHIHMLRFNVGLDSLTNHQDPTLAEAPLNDATMHWGWNPAAGYKFIVLEGRVDSNGDNVADDTDAEFVYHVATDALLGEKMITTHEDVSAGNTYTFMVHVDMANIASSIDFNNNLDTHTGNNMPLAIRVRDLLLSSMTAH